MDGLRSLEVKGETIKTTGKRKKKSDLLLKMLSKQQKPQVELAEASAASWLMQPSSQSLPTLAAFATEVGKTQCLLSQLHSQSAEAT